MISDPHLQQEPSRPAAACASRPEPHEKNGLVKVVARVNKCVFGTDAINYLGYHVTPRGIPPLKTNAFAVDTKV